MNPRPSLLATTLLASALSLVLAGQPPSPASVFTPAQAKAGRVAYEKTCGRCHTLTLMGRKGDSSELPPVSSLSDSDKKFIGARGYTYVPPLAGKDFLDRWGSKTAAQLIARFKVTAYDSAFGFEGMNDEIVVNITAYVLQVNGAKTGEQPLTLTTDAVVNAITR
jgi:mono/diheme cytochrome c family protein